MRWMPAKKGLFGLFLIALVCAVVLVCEDGSRSPDAVVLEDMKSPTIKSDEHAAVKDIKQSLSKVKAWVKTPWQWATDWNPKKAAMGLKAHQQKLSKVKKGLASEEAKEKKTDKMELQIRQAKEVASAKLNEKETMEAEKKDKQQIMRKADSIKDGVHDWVKAPWEWSLDERAGMHNNTASLAKELADEDKKLQEEKKEEKAAKEWQQKVLASKD